MYLQGKCEKQVQDVIERLWDFIEKLDINTFGKLIHKACILTYSYVFTQRIKHTLITQYIVFAVMN